jgi:hypothetical protein
VQYLLRHVAEDRESTAGQLVTHVAKKFCNVSVLNNEEYTSAKCNGLTILPIKAFYPIPRENWKDIYDRFINETELNALRNKVKDSYAVHLWNHESSMYGIEADAEYQLMVKLAQENCPITYETLADTEP